MTKGLNSTHTVNVVFLSFFVSVFFFSCGNISLMDGRPRILKSSQVKKKRVIVTFVFPSRFTRTLNPLNDIVYLP